MILFTFSYGCCILLNRFKSTPEHSSSDIIFCVKYIICRQLIFHCSSMMSLFVADWKQLYLKDSWRCNRLRGIVFYSWNETWRLVTLQLYTLPAFCRLSVTPTPESSSCIFHLSVLHCLLKEILLCSYILLLHPFTAFSRFHCSICV